MGLETISRNNFVEIRGYVPHESTTSLSLSSIIFRNLSQLYQQAVGRGDAVVQSGTMTRFGRAADTQ